MKNIEEEKKLNQIMNSKFDKGICPRCGTGVWIMKDEYKSFITDVDRKYKGICSGCITEEENIEIYLARKRYKDKEETREKLRVIK